MRSLSSRPPLRRLRLLTVVTVAAASMLPALAGRAETAAPGIAIEGWFARSKPANPQVNVPCPPPPLPPTPVGCGPVQPADVPAPQSPGTGAYVVASAGGDAGRADTAGDLGWAAFQWDLLSYFDADVQQFVVTLHQAPDNRGDTAGPWPIQACNIVAPWGGAPGANPWPTRPTIDDSTCVEPAVEGAALTFHVTSMAQTWIDGAGYGMAVVPGTPDQRSNLPPFQVTLAGYYSTAANASDVQPEVVFTFEPAFVDDFDAGFGSDFDSGGFVDVSPMPFDPNPSIDVFPNDVGSPAPVDEVTPVAAPPRVAVSPARSQDPGFPWQAWMLLPLAAALMFVTGSSLGPLGDPQPERRGGLDRRLAAHRQPPSQGRDR